MCRWIAYSGSPIYMDALITKPSHSLVEQSFDSEMNIKPDGNLWTTNGDGFGVGWYCRRTGEPGIFKSTHPAWNDLNLHEICKQVKTHIFFGHIRASSHGSIQHSNSHPFKFKNWMFQHNGTVSNFIDIKKSLMCMLPNQLFQDIKGTTDSELCFYLALHFGLEHSPKQALERMITCIHDAQTSAGFKKGISFSSALCDGEKIYTVRYASCTELYKSQFYKQDMKCIAAEDAADVSKNGIIIVSEPLDDYGQEWTEMPKNSFSIVHKGQISTEELHI